MTGIEMTASTLRYRNKTLSVAVGAFFLFGTAVFLGQAFHPGKAERA
jgi:hypothetical protein